MKRNETQRAREHKYTQVFDGRKARVRGLWDREGKFYARLTTETPDGGKVLKWYVLDARTVGAAKEELAKLKVDRTQDKLVHLGRGKTFAAYLDENYLPALDLSGKKEATIASEKCHLRAWKKTLGQIQLSKIRPVNVNAHLLGMKKDGLSARSRNLALVHLRNVLKAAKRDGLVAGLSAVEGLAWEKVDRPQRSLTTKEDIEKLCKAAFGTKIDEDGKQVSLTKNAQQFSDFVKLLALCGAREQEAIKLPWESVDFAGKRLTIGADGDTKNRESRTVDMSADLEAHLRDMHARRAPDSMWVFPSPQRGEADEHAKTFRESLKLAREAAGMPKIAFHDMRHHFISYAVMSGIDYMTVARWAGHRDGGCLIGRVYGHLSNEHTQAQAQKMNFGPAIVPLPAVGQ